MWIGGSGNMGSTDVVSLKHALDRVLCDTRRVAARSLDTERDTVLQLVVADGPIGSLEVAVALDMPPSQAIRNLRALAESRLVTIDCRAAAENRTVQATDAGREEARQITEASCNLLGVIVNDWRADDRSTLTALLSRLADDWSSFRQRL